MKYRNQLRIAGLLLAASLFAGVPPGQVFPAFAEETKEAPKAEAAEPIVPDAAGGDEAAPATPAQKETAPTAPAPAAGEEQKAAPGAPDEATAPDEAAKPAAAAPPAPAAAPKTPPVTPVSAPIDIAVPTDPVEKAAFEVLEKHCSRCHQAGRLTAREKPAKNFGNILKLDEIAANPALIQAGNPEGSKIFQQITNKEMPYDLYYEFDTSHPAVTADEIEALRAWIKSTGDQEARACTGRKFITSDDIVAAISADLERQPDHRVKGMRYLTLTNLYNSCTPDAAMDVYRQGVVKLLNGLGRRSDVVRLVTIDATHTIIAFNLQDLGWEAADWNTILSKYSYATKPDTRTFDFIAQSTDTKLPYIRADWFTFTASQPPLYDTLLKLPNTFPELAKSLNLDMDADIKNFVAQRAGFQKSGVSQNNRVIERHPIATGYFWSSYDFSGSKNDQSIFLHPLGPNVEGGFRHDGGETIYSLPNGFQAYYLSKADGTRLDKGPTQIVRDQSRRDLAVTNGISCMGCHEQGIRKAKDEVRAAVTADRSFKKEVRETVEALYPEQAQMGALLEDDAQRFNAAMRRAGLDPTLNLNGVEMTNSLYARYEGDLSLRRAAAEYGYAPDEFKKQFIEAGPEAIALMRRLEQGIVPRDQFEALFTKFVEGATEESVVDVANLAGAEKVADTVTPPAPGGTFDLVLTANQTDYRQNDAAVFTVVASRDCSLFVVNVGKDGVGTVIFPNQYQSDNAVKAGQKVVLGGDGGPFKFKLPDIGQEKVVALCTVNGSTREAFGFKVDPAKQGFAAIPDFEKVVSRQIAVEAGEVKAEASKLEGDAKKDAQAAKISAVEGNKVAADAPQSIKQTTASTAIVINVK
jgi:hypothetical protein